MLLNKLIKLQIVLLLLISFLGFIEGFSVYPFIFIAAISILFLSLKATMNYKAKLKLTLKTR